MKEIFIDSLSTLKINEVGSVFFSSLESCEYFLSLEEYIKNQFSRLCESKVISHIILTRSLFLMNYFDVYVDFENKKIFFVDENYKELYIRYSGDKHLYDILSIILKNTKYNSDDSYAYEDYRNETRKIFDNLDRYEDKPLIVIWKDLLKLSNEWFRTDHE